MIKRNAAFLREGGVFVFDIELVPPAVIAPILFGHDFPPDSPRRPWSCFELSPDHP
jgi:hypothetical protein